MTLNVAVEDVHDALAEAHDLIVRVEGGVDGASAVLDGGVVAVKTGGAEGAKLLGAGTVEVDAVLGHVTVGALDALALTGGVGVAIVEATKPEGAHIGGEGPLTNPDVVLEVLGVADSATVLVTVGADVTMSTTPGEVLMGVHDNVLVIVIVEKIVPGVGIEVEGVVEDELQAGLLLLHHGADVSVEVLEDIEVRAPPGLVDGLDGVKGGVSTVGVEESLDGILGPLNVVVVDAHVAAGVIIPLAHPLTEGVLPVREVVLVRPDCPVGETRVVVSVLGSLNGVHVEENLDLVFLGGVEDPLDLVGGTVSAANVRAVGLESPVTDGDTDDLDLSGGHLLEVVLSDPGIPMLTKHGVTLLGSKRLTESVLVHADTLSVGLLEEAVEKSWGDPGLKDLPATNVGADHGAAILGSESGGCSECSNSEGFHVESVFDSLNYYKGEHHIPPT